MFATSFVLKSALDKRTWGRSGSAWDGFGADFGRTQGHEIGYVEAKLAQTRRPNLAQTIGACATCHLYSYGTGAAPQRQRALGARRRPSGAAHT